MAKFSAPVKTTTFREPGGLTGPGGLVQRGGYMQQRRLDYMSRPRMTFPVADNPVLPKGMR